METVPAGHIPPHVGGIAAVDGKTGFLYKVGQQVLDIPAFFFPPFKAQDHSACEGVPVGYQDPGGGEQHGHVAVVAAGVGYAGHLRHAQLGLFQVPGIFLDGQGIYIRPHEQGLAGFATVR
jgi:hypothetical protein